MARPVSRGNWQQLAFEVALEALLAVTDPVKLGVGDLQTLTITTNLH